MPSATNANGSLLSPADSDTFSTPPTSPGPGMVTRPSLSRKNSRPSSLTLNKANRDEWAPDILLEENSPGVSRKSSSNGRSTVSGEPMTQETTITPRSSTAPEPIPSYGNNNTSNHKNGHKEALNSPCFVHSHLDKGASLTEWLRNKNAAAGRDDLDDVGVTHTLREGDKVHSASSRSFSIDDWDDDEYSHNLTRQLAETAVGVREMSKQLGRARIQSNIQNVLIVTKARDNRLIKLTREVALYLMLKPRPGHSRGLTVYVDNQLRTSRRFDAAGMEHDHPELFIPMPRRRSSSSTSLSSMASNSVVPSTSSQFDIHEEGQLRYWTPQMCNAAPHLFDFVITLGGDGTVLFTSWLFQRIVPPVLPFALGSLGFLTNFDFADNKAVLDSAIDNGIRVNLRMRFTCTVYRAITHPEGKGRKAVKKGETGEIMMKNVGEGGWEALEGGWNTNPSAQGACGKDKEIMCFSTRPVETFEVLNDLVVDRGPSPYVSLLELFGDEHHMTTVQADGLTISTPTGSTAYSLSAGGSLVHPEIPAILITPICPHTLSFRPMLLPDSMELRICVPYNSRSTAWASFDGRGRVELKQGDHIKVTASKYPFPTVCAQNQSTDWFNAISRTLKWNERERQKSFVVVEEGPSKEKKKKRTKHERAVHPAKPNTVSEGDEEDEEVEMDEEDENTDEEEKFDIDDSSPEAPKIGGAEKLNSDAANPNDHSIGAEKAREVAEGARRARMATQALKLERERSLDRTDSGPPSGIQTPGRFAEMYKSPRSTNSKTGAAEEDGARDDIHSVNGRLLSSRSKIPKDRDSDLKTPTMSNALYRQTEQSKPRTKGNHHFRARARSVEPRGSSRVAFAVWGQDESDSNASDSDADP